MLASDAPPTEVADGFEPNSLQRMAARVLRDDYPQALQQRDLAAKMWKLAGRREPVAQLALIAREMEAMARASVISIDKPDSPSAYYGLTRHGRDFMLALKSGRNWKPP